MSLPVISVEGLSKAYQIYKKPTDMMLEMLTGKQRHDLFWALRDISFEVNEHDRIGIIGANGSGKSTLLKIITGNLQPSSGKVTVRGNISAMLSLATSLNPEETGLSNIRFNLMLNGCQKNRVSQLTEEIIEFTELGSFIYQPVKTYSSGMNAKLAFGIATAIEPEILIVDEVLSVGDGYFVSKAMKRMVELCDRGKALLFVSHATSAVQMLCNKVIWMDNGQIRQYGSAEEVLRSYEEDFRKVEDAGVRAGNAKKVTQINQSGLLTPEEAKSPYRLRIIPAEGGSFYIRNIVVKAREEKWIVSLYNKSDESHTDESVFLDLQGSSWGRLYSRDGDDCRMLSPRTGMSKGGGIVLSQKVRGEPVSVSISFEAASDQEHGELDVEYVDLISGTWVKVSDFSSKGLSLKKGWKEYSASFEFPPVKESQLKLTQEKLDSLLRPDIEIIDIYLVSQGKQTGCINEQVRFEIHVKVLAIRNVERVDVGINIYRDDGVYVFWQSSGMDGVELTNFIGESTVVFSFESNPISRGNYYIGGYCGNGWDPEINFPHSEIFNFKVNYTSFTVKPLYDLISFGLVNVRASVMAQSV